MKKRNNKKGFTLVEIIVVLVIVAILAAAGIPAMMGFINESRGKALIAEARVGYVALQAAYTEVYLSGNPPTQPSTPAAGATGQFPSPSLYLSKFQDYLDTELAASDFTYRIDYSTNKIAGLVYDKGGAGDYFIVLIPGQAATVQQGGTAPVIP